MNFNRLGKYLSDWIRFNQNKSVRSSREVVAIIETILPFLGIFSKSRKNLMVLGKALLQQRRLTVFAPVCFTEKGVDGAMKLIESHCYLLEKLNDLFEVVFLIPDTQASDTLLLTFRTQFSQYCFNVMYEYFKELTDLEEEQMKVILSSPQKLDRVLLDLSLRQSLYKRLRIASREEQVRLACKTSAEYRAFALCVKERGGLVLCHTTTNLRHFKDMEVGVLHNDYYI